MIDRLFVFNSSYQSKEALFSNISNLLAETGHVDIGFEKDLLNRELTYPTALPLEPPAAIPHTDGTHVLKDAIVCVLNTSEMEFHALGGTPEDLVYPRLVFVLALRKGGNHLQILQSLVDHLQDAQFVNQVLASESEDEFQSLVASCF